MLLTTPAYKNKWYNEIFAGITTGLLVIPEALLFSFLAGVNTIIGIFSFLVIGSYQSIFGGKSGIISGPERVSSMLLAIIIAENGAMYLIPSTIFIGLVIFVVGHLKIAKFIRLISKSTLIGFMNGLAISIIITQFKFFRKDQLGSISWF